MGLKQGGWPKCQMIIKDYESCLLTIIWEFDGRNILCMFQTNVTSFRATNCHFVLDEIISTKNKISKNTVENYMSICLLDCAVIGCAMCVCVTVEKCCV